MGKNLLKAMNDANRIHFNLDGMMVGGETVEELRSLGRAGIGEGNITNWELDQALGRFGDKTTLYLPSGVEL